MTTASHTCERCKKTFSTKGSLTAHKNKTTRCDLNFMTCHTCDRKFQGRNKSQDLKRHKCSIEIFMAIEEELDYFVIKLHRRGYPWPPHTTSLLCDHGNLTLLKYAHEHGCPWDEYTTKAAIKNGHLDCLKYAIEHGCPCGEFTTCRITENNYWKDGVFYYKNDKPWTIDCIKYAHEHGCPWDRYTTSTIENVELLQYAIEHGCPWAPPSHNVYTGNGNLACMIYAHEHGSPWGLDTTYFAARDGLDLLTYAHEHGCPWGVHTTTSAAEHGKLECLRYAHEKGCPWDSSTTYAAAENGHMECLQYAHKNGCLVDDDTTIGAARNGHVPCLQYIRDNGLYWHPETLRYANEKAARYIIELSSVKRLMSILDEHCTFSQDRYYLEACEIMKEMYQKEKKSHSNGFYAPIRPSAAFRSPGYSLI